MRLGAHNKHCVLFNIISPNFPLIGQDFHIGIHLGEYLLLFPGVFISEFRVFRGIFTEFVRSFFSCVIGAFDSYCIYSKPSHEPDSNDPKT